MVSKADLPLHHPHQPHLGPSHPGGGDVSSSSHSGASAAEESDGSLLGVSGAAAAVGRAVERDSSAVQGGTGEPHAAQEQHESGGQESRHVPVEASAHESLKSREADKPLPCTAQQGISAEAQPEEVAPQHGMAGGWRNLSTGAAGEHHVPHAVTSDVGGVRGRGGVALWEEYKRARGPAGALRVSVHTASGMSEVCCLPCLFVQAIFLFQSIEVLILCSVKHCGFGLRFTPSSYSFLCSSWRGFIYSCPPNQNTHIFFPNWSAYGPEGGCVVNRGTLLF